MNTKDESTVVMKNVPPKIYLNIGAKGMADDFKKLCEVTYSKKRIHEDDIEYTLTPAPIDRNMSALAILFKEFDVSDATEFHLSIGGRSAYIHKIIRAMETFVSQTNSKEGAEEDLNNLIVDIVKYYNGTVEPRITFADVDIYIPEVIKNLKQKYSVQYASQSNDAVEFMTWAFKNEDYQWTGKAWDEITGHDDFESLNHEELYEIFKTQTT